MPPIKAIIFDYGGVINARPDKPGISIFQALCSELGFDIEEFKALYFANNHRNNLGDWTHTQTLLHVVERIDASKKEEAEKLIDDFNQKCSINQELLEYIEKIKSLGYTVALLSNYNSVLREVIAKNGVAEIFGENIFVSTEIGYQKPDPKAFEHTFEKLGCKPEEVVFIDDSPMSLSTAEEVGYHPIQFTSNEQLLEDLQAVGIDLAN